MHLQPGSALGRYELLMPLAQGGMATVWAARLKGSHGFERTVAIKSALPKLSEDPAFETMFLNEARLAMRVTHPNVAQVLDLGEAEGVVFLVMEWIDGEAVSAIMRTAGPETGVPLRIALHICIKACAGLHAAHEVHDEDDRPIGIVHRDVSPQNVMVTYQGFVKVVDFGIAKAEEQFVSTTRTGQFKGKVPYMSPEQATGGVVDRRTDIFALGTMLYKLSTGQHPFIGSSDIATLHRLIYEKLRPPSELVPDYPPALERVVLKCMATDVSARYATMAELQEDLERAALQVGPAVSEQELSGFMTKQFAERRADRRKQMRESARSLGWAVVTNEALPRVSQPSNGFVAPGELSLFTPSHPSKSSATVVSSPTGETVQGFAQEAAARGKATGSRTYIMLMLAALVGGAAAAALIFWLREPRPEGSGSSASAASTSAAVGSTGAPLAPTSAPLAQPTATPVPDASSATAALASSAPLATDSPSARASSSARQSPPGGQKGPAKGPTTSRPWQEEGPDVGF